ncbi:MAG: 3-oxoacyl-[acyl-carrier-protein] reductase [Candidatus Firestonebacteria bacterium RIFOXYC2_FULL_39_67]|nr:MAG: 3-oxoacyl-[acyl-carrier-protein] reductase [Candidatus Firestonebacteria bacterium RIFOXYD2_FULL_39_29]OGF53367.1 MAG: 3-oxoacyl-[acyl-carrier-protein] reductase [Candidatus Firestonebacteria bacterium RifOxyC12_full_39_7]OGF53767.1 MAG: 3-oxoacyl-[acyl-carrier-protein] reductase [Candidatus Firestonebacteria bacterium RIFOXYC2_FULL_39_67]
MLKGKVALVTGAAQGIGKAIAETLAKEGANVAICDVNIEKAEETAKELAKLGIKTAAYKTNVSVAAECDALIDSTVKDLGKLDILVNNAGVTRDGLLIRMSEQDWDLVIAINLKGTFNCTKAAVKTMMKARYGRIINISSVIGLMGNAGQVNYAASKSGVLGITRSIAKEYANRNITVNAVAPGYIQTAMTDKLTEEQKQAMLKFVPLSRMGQPQDVANGVLFFASPLADYVTGQVLAIDGGMVMS